MYILCLHCHNAIELVRLTPRQEINCPSCGSSFNLETDTTTSESNDRKTLGKFEILETVGHGAFGTVYKARDPELDRTVALKVPRAGNLAGPQELDRFLREARSVAQLRHPSIVTVHDVGQSNGLPYLVSDFVEGLTLADLLSARRPSFRESAQLAADVADALQYAHDQGVVHRDVKPSNIMLESRESPIPSASESSSLAPHPSTLIPRLMDFGLAKRDAGEITMTVDGQVLGTPAYMSPEQARGEGHDVDGRCDVYSVGVILYQMLTGELPFRGTTRMLLHQVLHEQPRSPRSINERVPRDLETICLKAMAKEPERRYAAARGLADDLRRFVDGEPIHARPVGRVERTMRWCRRNRVATALIISLVVGIASTTWKSNWALHERDRADGEARTAEQIAADEKNERARAEGLLYASRLTLAKQFWNENRAMAAIDALDKLDETQEHRNEWEHRYLYTQMYHRGQFTFRGHTEGVYSISFGPDGRLASASADKTVNVWDAQSGQVLMTLKGHTRDVTSVSFSPDGRWLASASLDRTVKVRDAQSGQDLLTLNGHTDGVDNVSFSPDGRRLASASLDRTMRVWDAQSGQDLLTLHGHTQRVSSISFGPDGRLLASASNDQTVKVWDAQSGRHLLTLTDAATSVNFSPDGRSLATACRDNTVKVWDPQSGQCLLTLTGHTQTVTSVRFSPNGRQLASASFDRTVKVWDAKSGQNLLTLRGHTGDVTSVSFSPDGRRLASAGGYDRAVKIWDTQLGQDDLTLHGHTQGVLDVSFSPDGMRLASASFDKTVKVWDAQSGQDLLTLKGVVMSRHALLTSALFALAVAGPHARSADDAQDEAVKRFKEALQGKWQMTARIEDGVPSASEIIRNRTVTIEGDKWTTRDGENVIGEPSYKVDPTKKPAWLDVTHKGASAKGIIKLEGDTLTFCVGSDGTRPSDFKSERSDGRLLGEFKKVKK